MKLLWTKRGSWGLLLAAALGCAGMGEYVWADTLPETPATAGAEYRLAPGDLIFVRVFNQDPLSGRTPQELAKTMEARLRDFIKAPVVTVFLEELGPAQLSVIGEVARPGIYPLERGQGVLRALAAAGGLTEFAHKDRIFLVRAGSPGRIRFRLEQLSIPGTRSARFRLQNEDVVMVQ